MPVDLFACLAVVSASALCGTAAAWLVPGSLTGSYWAPLSVAGTGVSCPVFWGYAAVREPVWVAVLVVYATSLVWCELARALMVRDGVDRPPKALVKAMQVAAPLTLLFYAASLLYALWVRSTFQATPAAEAEDEEAQA